MEEQIIVDVGMDAFIASLRELQKQYAANIAEMKRLKDAGEENSDEYIKLTQSNKVLRQEMSGVEKQMQNEIKTQKANEGSLVQLRAQLANLNKQYDSMSGFDRMGKAGIELQDRIKGLSDQISGLEASTGRYQRNVGNYKSALEGLSGSFRVAGLSTKGLDQSLKLLNANPWMMLLTAAVTIIRNVVAAFKGNEAAVMALREAFSAFNPIMDYAKRGLEAFANMVVKVVSTAVNGLTSALGWLLDKAQQIGNFFGADWHMGDNFREGVTAARELQAAENDYIKAKRAWSVESAKIDQQVADLREKASDKEKYNAQERVKFLDEAIALETKKAKKQKEFAEWNLRNLEAEAARSANDAAMNDKLAEAQRAVIEASTNLSNVKRTLNKQRQTAIGENNKLAASYSNVRDKLEDFLTTYKRVLQEAKEESLADVLQGVGGTKTAAEVIEEMTEGYDKLETKVEKMPDISDKFKPSAFEQFSAAFINNAETIEETISGLSSSFGSMSSIYKTMAEDESKSEEERAKAAKKAKTWAAMQIAANSGTAIAKGVASAMDTPFPANLAALATTLAAVLSAIAQAKALAIENHETGGVIGGKFTGATMGRDNVLMTGRRSELVLNANQQKRLFDIANGTLSPSLTSQLVEALRTMPAPVVDYQEFTRFSERVALYNENSKLK